MQFLIVGSLFVAGASAQLVHYPNGAIAPYDPNNAAATAAHLEATAEAGKLINPFGVHATGLVHPVHYYGKREAQVLDPATNLVTYPNGAVAPFDPNVAAATAYHYSAKAAHGYYPFLGAANVHPAAAVVYGRKKREAQVPVSLVTGYAHTPYFGGFFGHVAPVVAPFTAHPNGALVPAEPADVVEAREAHLAAVAEAGRKKREAQVPVNLVTGLTATSYLAASPFGYFGHHVAITPVTSPFTAHPNGALVPEEPADVVEARAAHLAAVAEAGRKKREAQVPVNLVTGLTATSYLAASPFGFLGHHVAVAPVTSPFTAYPNGALVPEEPADVAEARAAHLEALAAASK
jgi:hypothetical protein